MTNLQPGDEIQGTRGPFRIEEFLGRGGFGASYRARASDGTQVTLKQLRVERLDSWKSLELFEREANTLAELEHPRIPRFVELFVTDGKSAQPIGRGPLTEVLGAGLAVILVQSYVAGRSLQAVLDSGERLDAADALRMMRELLEVLEYLHGRAAPVIHRDIKPSNVILDELGGAHLIDFGAIQTQIRAAGEAGSTMIGTLGYFPQEQLLGRALPSSDLYALGMTALVGLTGRSPEQLPIDALTGKVQVPAGLPAPLARWLAAVLEPAPGQRPASARIARGLLDDGAAARPERPQRRPAASWQRWPYRLLLAGSLGSAGLIHTMYFNRFSESALVSMAPYWVVPAVFASAGLISHPAPRHFVHALLAALAGWLLLALFLGGIFGHL